TYDLSGTSQANAHIGANWHNEDKVVQKFFLGLIDDVRVYHHALSEGEIAQLVAGL
ncbi:MAG: LamG-like jellyroll fold domain-containing protein, partial [Planctomycetota bacterium]